MAEFSYSKYCFPLPATLRQGGGILPTFDLCFDRATKKSFADDDVGIAHGENPSYWSRREASQESEFGRVARLQTVCWLELSCVTGEVPAGMYLAYARIHSQGREFSGNWFAGMESRGLRQFEPDEAHHGSEAITFIPNRDSTLPVNRWIYVVIGIIRITSLSRVHFNFFGGNPYWTNSILFDHAGLIPLRIGWDLKRLLLLGMKNSSTGQSSPPEYTWSLKRLLFFGGSEDTATETAPSPFRLLNQDCMNHILRFL